MRKVLFVSAVVLLAALSLAVCGQENKPEQPQAGPDMQAMMEVYAKASVPCKEHEFIAKMEGTWVTVVKFYAMGPEPAISYGISENKMVLGGRFMLQKFTNSAMGRPMEGIGLSGYDCAQKKVIGIWTDSMGTGMMTSEGSIDLEKKTMSTISSYYDPVTKQIKKSKDEMKFAGEDTMVFQMYEKDDKGREFLQMEITYSRVHLKGEIGE